MMIIMDRFTAKHDWQVKVFDDAIAHRWIEEALALADKELYDEIVQKQPYSTASPRRVKSILDRRCAEYVGDSPLVALRWSTGALFGISIGISCLPILTAPPPPSIVYQGVAHQGCSF